MTISALLTDLPDAAHEFEPARATREEWARLHRFRRLLHGEERPDEPPEPDAAAEAGLRQGEPFYEERHLVLERDGEVVSRLSISAVRPGTVEFESNRHHVHATIEVHPDHRRRRVGASWLPALAAYARGREANLVSFDVGLESGHRFAEWLGAKARMQELESRLWLDRADWPRIESWLAIDPGGHRLERYEPFPPSAIWDAYARGYTELERHVPREQMQIGDWILTPERMAVHERVLREKGRTLHVLAAWDGEGLSGITEMIHAEHEPDALEQQLTAVHPRARGRGLARLLKARLLVELRGRYPDARFVRTWNAGSNDAMWAINQEMGFVRHRLYVGYQVEVDRLPRG